MGSIFTKGADTLQKHDLNSIPAEIPIPSQPITSRKSFSEEAIIPDSYEEPEPDLGSDIGNQSQRQTSDSQIHTPGPRNDENIDAFSQKSPHTVRTSIEVVIPYSVQTASNSRLDSFSRALGEAVANTFNDATASEPRLTRHRTPDWDQSEDESIDLDHSPKPPRRRNSTGVPGNAAVVSDFRGRSESRSSSRAQSPAAAPAPFVKKQRERAVSNPPPDKETNWAVRLKNGRFAPRSFLSVSSSVTPALEVAPKTPAPHIRNSFAKKRANHQLEASEEGETPVFAREKNGRFASAKKAEKAVAAVILTPQPSARKTPVLVRDKNGKFAPKTPVPANSNSVAPAAAKRRQRAVSKPPAAVKETPVLVRDRNGRFAPKASVSQDGESAAPVENKERQRAVSNPPAPKRETPVLVRDRSGRFAPKIFAPKTVLPPNGESSAPFASKKRRRTASNPPASMEEISNETLDKNESENAAKKQKRTPTLKPKPPADQSPSENKSSTLVRAPNGRFAPKKDTPKSQAQNAKYSSSSNPTPSEQGSMVAQDEPQKSNDFSIEIPVKVRAKAKRPPAKSPYFASPKTPPKNRQGKGPEQDSERSNPETPSEGYQTAKTAQSSEKKRPPAGIVSCIPFPPLDAPYFGLIQEKLANDPFRLIIAVTFLIRTHGKHAIPVFFSLMDNYPTPESLVAADKEDIISIIQHLGLQNQRANTYQTYAKIWLENPPAKDKRYPIRGYPTPESGKDVKKDEVLKDDDPRHAWEIGHMTSGPYALDSWRIFCRDKCRGLAWGWNGEGSSGETFQPEWMRVQPEDKELRAFLRWMWLKEGFEWDPVTGEKEVASREVVRAAMEGRVVWDETGGLRVCDHKATGDGGLTQVGNVPGMEMGMSA